MKFQFHHLIHKQHILTSGFSKRKQRNIPRSGAAAGMLNLKGVDDDLQEVLVNMNKSYDLLRDINQNNTSPENHETQRIIRTTVSTFFPFITLQVKSRVKVFIPLFLMSPRCSKDPFPFNHSTHHPSIPNPSFRAPLLSGPLPPEVNASVMEGTWGKGGIVPQTG